MGSDEWPDDEPVISVGGDADVPAWHPDYVPPSPRYPTPAGHPEARNRPKGEIYVSKSETDVLMPLLALRARLDELDVGRDLVWVFPRDFAVGLKEAWGMPIIRADVKVALLAYENTWKHPEVVIRESHGP